MSYGKNSAHSKCHHIFPGADVPGKLMPERMLKMSQYRISVGHEEEQKTEYINYSHTY